ncbi:hypothetical protein POM88_025164 [Heracleum sosnowskyi]|uniref:Transposase-associated domain-containing protein n=1 Tax=Heracleum sosnowskyi TaxID=360622 RepID=A0AAD8MJJ8_9APIA|nr:hypothetical protein POM88_025164 [Heracleum sosnowskyi]
MASDRSWIGRNRFNEAKYLTEEYKIGVNNFLKFAWDNLKEEDNGLIRCPCKNCGNDYFMDPNDVKVDLYRYGIMPWYTIWDLHGEKDMLQDEAGTIFANNGNRDDDMYDAHDMLRDFEEANRHFENVEEEPNASAKEFYKMEYYKYPDGYGTEAGDYGVREHLRRNFKHLLNPERKRADAQVKLAKEKGRTKVTRLNFKPHYFSIRVWESLNKYWTSDVFEKRSDIGKKVRENVEVTTRTGAKPYSQKWEEMEEEKKEPITALEFANVVYKFDKPREQEFKDKLMQVESSQSQLTLEALPTEPPSSPKSKKKMHRTKKLLKIIQARPPKKGKAIMFPRHTVIEFIGVQGALEWTISQPSQNVEVQVPESVYSVFPRVLREVSQMVISLPTHEATQAQLDEEIQNLANVAFPDKYDMVQQSMWSQYVRSVTSCLDHILKTNQKVL